MCISSTSFGDTLNLRIVHRRLILPPTFLSLWRRASDYNQHDGKRMGKQIR